MPTKSIYTDVTLHQALRGRMSESVFHIAAGTVVHITPLAFCSDQDRGRHHPDITVSRTAEV
jgi:hypothetical protein